MSDLLKNIDKIHTTIMGVTRIVRNVDVKSADIAMWCKNAIENAELAILMGKNWYIYFKGIAITVNAKSYTVITAHKICGKVREMKKSDYPCLDEFLYQAIFVPSGDELPPREIIYTPDIYIYIKDFGCQAGDLGVVAEQNGQIVGAAWARIIAAYGHIANDTPELAISILPEFRGCGIGGKLMKKLFVLLKEKGYKRTSLLVQNDNPATRFYERLGYKISGRQLDSVGHEDYLMIKDL